MNHTPGHLRCWAEIDTVALQHNARAAGQLAGGGPDLVMAVVKADAYGHGLPLVARALSGVVGAFAVANLYEAREVRACAPHTPVYILSPALPEEVEDIVAGGFIPALSNEEEARRFAATAKKQSRSLAVHAVMDTGMGRMGALPDKFPALLATIRQSSLLTLDSVSSHFPSSDEDESFTRTQEEEFRQHMTAMEQRYGPIRAHIANSAGILHYPRVPGEAVRAGLMLYGVSPLAEHQGLVHSVLTWKARVTLVRDLPTGWGVSYGRTHVTAHPAKVAAISAGYGDGYPRHVSGKGACVLIGGRRCPVLGRVTMDQIIVDVSAVTSPPAPGDEVVLLGKQGAGEISAVELAALAETIPWHLFTGITPRTARVEAAHG